MSSSSNKPSLRRQGVNLNAGAVSIEQAPYGQIVTSSKNVRDLSDIPFNRLARLYQTVGYVIDESVEKWITDFTDEVNLEPEIQVWEQIAVIFDKYNKTHRLTLPQKRGVVKRLIRLVGGERMRDSVSLELLELFQKERASTFLIRPSKSQQLWVNIDAQMLAQIYTEYVQRHQLGSQDNNTDLFVALMGLMSGNEPSTELDKELLEIWKYLEQSESDNQPYFDPNDISDEREKRLKEVVIRPGQRKFKSELMKAYERRCSITGCPLDILLEAAHIIPYLGAKTDHPSNGLLLRVDIHRLFDSHYLSISPETNKVKIAPILKNTHYEMLAGKPLRMPKSETERPNPEALYKHYKIFLLTNFTNTFSETSATHTVIS